MKEKFGCECGSKKYKVKRNYPFGKTSHKLIVRRNSQGNIIKTEKVNRKSKARIIRICKKCGRHER